MIGQCLDCSAKAAAEVFLTGFTTDFRAEMEAITVPTLIVHGDHDMQAPIDIFYSPSVWKPQRPQCWTAVVRLS